MDVDSNSGPPRFSHRSWLRKFQAAFVGLVSGLKGRGHGKNSFIVHVPVALIVIVAGFVLRIDRSSMALLLLCIGFVFVAELFNTSLELLAKAVTEKPNDHVKAALDIASGAVLMASITAASVGLIVLSFPTMKLLGW